MQTLHVNDRIRYDEEARVKEPLFSGAHSRTTLWCLEIGQEIKPHTHAGDHVWVVVEGEGFYLTDGGETPVRVGSVIFAPEGEPHGMRAATRLAFVSTSAG